MSKEERERERISKREEMFRWDRLRCKIIMMRLSERIHEEGKTNTSGRVSIEVSSESEGNCCQAERRHDAGNLF